MCDFITYSRGVKVDAMWFTIVTKSVRENIGEKMKYFVMLFVHLHKIRQIHDQIIL